MLTLEQQVKDQFAKVFSASDWRLFKEIAEIYFCEAAFLKKSDFDVPMKRKLLVRNSRKRLLIGLGVELLVKAVYLRAGYCINKPETNNAPMTPPFKPADATAAHVTLNRRDTYTLGRLIEKLGTVAKFQNQKLEVVKDGLRIAAVYRNKEGHIVTRRHKYVASSFRAIEGALVDLYESVFGEKLSVRFSFASSEKGAWHVDSGD